jgi:hypothetical protein
MFLGLPDPDLYSKVWIWIRILPFSHKGVERTEIMLAKKNSNTKFRKKLPGEYLRLKIMSLRLNYKNKIWGKILFLASLKLLKKRVGSGVGSGSIS